MADSLPLRFFCCFAETGMAGWHGLVFVDRRSATELLTWNKASSPQIRLGLNQQLMVITAQVHRQHDRPCGGPHRLVGSIFLSDRTDLHCGVTLAERS